MMIERATEQTVETVLRHYVICALWSSTGEDDEPLDRDFGPEDVAPEALESMRGDVTAFLFSAWDDLGLDLSPIEPEQLGHDFWLTRNGHGAGFWDRGLGELGDALTSLARGYGDSYLYVGDDGLVHVQ